MQNTANDDVHREQPEDQPAKKKGRKATKPKLTIPQQSIETEEEPAPLASSSAMEITKANDCPKQDKALSLYDLPGHAAQEAFNELVKAQAICLNDFKTQFLRNNIEAMAQILDLTAATVPCESHGLLKARDMLTGGAQAKAKGPSSEAPQQPPQQSRAKPNSSEISHTLCAWARYEGARRNAQGLTLDATGRLSLNNIMEVWGKGQGLCEADIVQAIQQHTKAEGGDRYATQATQNDFYIQVRPSRSSQQGNFQDAVGAPPRHRRRGHA